VTSALLELLSQLKIENAETLFLIMISIASKYMDLFVNWMAEEKMLQYNNNKILFVLVIFSFKIW
jgi:hypothetical protein